MTSIRVFVSYSWNIEESTGIVDEIEALCPPRKIKLIRDRNEIQHGDLIMDFMDKLTGGEHIITVFSKAYFNSKWCMYELLKTWQKGEFQERTHPVIADDCDLQNVKYRMDMVEHWVKEHQELKEVLSGRDPSLFIEEFKKLNILRDISQNINDLMNFAAGRLTTSLADLREAEYAQFLDQISPIHPPFMRAVENSISQALDEENLTVFRGVVHTELNKLPLIQDSGEAVVNASDKLAEGLVHTFQNGGEACPAINKVLRNAATSCLAENGAKYEADQQIRQQILKSVERILGYLVLGLVDVRDARTLSDWLHDDLSDLYFELHVATEGGVEMFISHYQERQAQLKVGKGRKVSGRYLICVQPNMVGFTEAAKIAALQCRIWNFITGDNAEVLSEEQLKELKADLVSYYTMDDENSNFCVAIPFDNSQGADYRSACQGFLREHMIPVVQFKVEGGQGAFHGLEHNLISAVKLLLLKLNQLT